MRINTELLQVGVTVFDKQGRFGARASDGRRDTSAVTYRHPSPLKPGIDQVRVAARDDRRGTHGSAMQWIVISDLAARQPSLSSLILGLEGVAERGAEAERVCWSVGKNFARGTRLKFLTFVYNAARPAGAAADPSAQVRVYRDGRTMPSTPSRKIAPGPPEDPARVPSAGEIGLGELPRGRYLPRVTVDDRAARRTVTRQSHFYVRCNGARPLSVNGVINRPAAAPRQPRPPFTRARTRRRLNARPCRFRKIG